MPVQQLRAQNKLIIQSIFWVLSAVILYRLFTIDYDNGWADIIFTALFHLPLVVVVILHHRLIDTYFLTKRYLYYVLGVVGLLLLGLLLFKLTFGPIAKILAPKYYISLYFSNWELIQYLIVYIAASLLLVLAINWFYIKNQQLVLEKESNTANLRLLKAQLNPHFLFNSLNNIYSLLGKDSDAGQYILKLSDSLRYMTYETDEPFVPLFTEIEYLENYIDLEKLRISNSDHISFVVEGKNKGQLIAPLLLLPIIENSFKHCDREQPMITINLLVNKDEIKITAQNNIGEAVESNGGVGIANLKKRLALIYPDQHHLTINIVNNLYTVSLDINLDVHDN